VLKAHSAQLLSCLHTASATAATTAVAAQWSKLAIVLLFYPLPSQNTQLPFPSVSMLSVPQRLASSAAAAAVATAAATTAAAAATAAAAMPLCTPRAQNHTLHCKTAVLLPSLSSVYKVVLFCD
jgi:hypothetical protein